MIGGRRSDVQNLPRTPGQHIGTEQTAESRYRDDIQLQHALQLCAIKRGVVTIEPYTRVVDEPINNDAKVFHFVVELGCRARISQVDRDCMNLDAVLGAQSARKLIKLWPASTDENKVAMAGCKLPSHLPTDSGTRARDEHDRIFYGVLAVHGHGLTDDKWVLISK
ncbi:hypothetical protein AWC35_02730 [Gibbsiella quercinecans]|uniref:Uncharacterized protein n=1 Tax=Gibbsiella quercinecans TaxID=929813 RepID=A0A250AWL2_9GAMM|nr:hypothetical protein AWC35_02730 [Gibbsiella quercinecans]RLM14441.1 hypothetical protein BIY30_02660 [Gibbsiella quercinecans]